MHRLSAGAWAVADQLECSDYILYAFPHELIKYMIIPTTTAIGSPIFNLCIAS